MSMTTDDTTPAPPRRLRYPALVEMIILGGIALVLMLALSMIHSLVLERASRARAARAEIAASWGQSQILGGPVLIVPYRVRYISAGKILEAKHHAHFLPDRLVARGRLLPERRHRGIFETVLYRAQLRVEGEFARPDFSGWDVAPTDILWNEAILTVGVSDLRGIGGNPVMQWNGGALKFSGGSGNPRLWASGLTASNPFPGGPTAARYPFAMNLSLNGSEHISFYPLGRETVVELTSPWPDPSFSGAFLPQSRRITDQGFSARWSISSLARSYPQQWRTNDEPDFGTSLVPSAFSVGLFSPVSHYQQAERSVKYGALFIVLTFVTFFLYELLSPVSLHPVQYFLVGGALCVFYVLLLSISEHAPFGMAYAIASVATVSLITMYGAALLKSALRVAGLAAVLAMLYGYLYVLLQLEDWALLMGSIGLFLILALVMYATRRVDWGTAHLGFAREKEA
ncbi:MAG TPA: cell envelope integrity protein CreD [Thermoanaerobaculia bacterium]|nr:cell envelope integrity protein CreD [Thermoanaerobaculia bacterium]